MFPQDTHRYPFIHMGTLLSRISIRLSATMRPSHLAHCMGPSSVNAEAHDATPTSLLSLADVCPAVYPSKKAIAMPRVLLQPLACFSSES